MSSSDSAQFIGRNDHLRRLELEFYRGPAAVHWTMTMQDRKTGWLIPIYYYKFREILTHTMFRYGLCCPIYCCMPDHLHLLWMGLMDSSDQLLAVKFFRKQLGPVLEKLGVALQREAFDNVLREEELEKSAFEDIVEYIARNPERANLIERDGFQKYPFTGCLVPGYPELELWEPDSWTRFWRCYSYLRTNGLIRGRSDDTSAPDNL